MGKKLWSIFTDDMDHCYFTGSPEVERHHVFGAANRSRSEVYGYVIPLHPHLHPNGVHFKHTKENLKIDEYLKQRCQERLREESRQQRGLYQGVRKVLFVRKPPMADHYMSQHLTDCHFNIISCPRFHSGGRKEQLMQKIDMDVAMTHVSNVLRTGSDNAVSRKYIASVTGYSDRIVRECIERLRATSPIISNTDGSGYYIATKDWKGVADATRWIKGQQNRVQSIRKSMEGAEKLIRDVNYGEV